MDGLRWILLGIAVVFVVGLYFWSRNRKKGSEFSSGGTTTDVHSFSAQEDKNGWVDGVGPVRVVSQNDEEPLESFHINDDEQHSNYSGTQFKESPIPQTQKAPEESEPVRASDSIATDDVVALYLVAQRGDELKGEQILSATYATQLEYGDMKIFHRKDNNQKIVFSMANMMEPGWFEFDKMHEIRTRGISLFMQLGLCDNPVKALDDMLVCAHSLSSMLNTQLCDANRQLLNESYANALREKAKNFARIKQEQSATDTQS